jgi:hypothetical protein
LDLIPFDSAEMVHQVGARSQDCHPLLRFSHLQRLRTSYRCWHSGGHGREAEPARLEVRFSSHPPLFLPLPFDADHESSDPVSSADGSSTSKALSPSSSPSSPSSAFLISLTTPEASPTPSERWHRSDSRKTPVRRTKVLILREPT